MADVITQTVRIEASLTKIQSDLKTLEGNFKTSFANISSTAQSAFGALVYYLPLNEGTGTTATPAIGSAVCTFVNTPTGGSADNEGGKHCAKVLERGEPCEKRLSQLPHD